MLCALHVSAEVFRTNEIPVVPAEDLVPPPEDQESLIIRHPNDQPKTFFQRIVNWFGLNPNAIANAQKNRRPPPLSQAPPPPPPPPLPQKLQHGPGPGPGPGPRPNYVFENPAKPFTPQPQSNFPIVSGGLTVSSSLWLVSVYRKYCNSLYLHPTESAFTWVI